MALRGVRVLDLSRVLAGPYCTMLLGDLGAEVLKIERPSTGDETRSWGPPFLPPTSPGVGHSRQSTYFLAVNRNKKSVAVDLAAEEGRRLVHELAKKSDVLVHNFLPDVALKLGLDYVTLSSLNPSLVYCSITGYGATGPYSSKGGYDVIVSGMYGLMDITGDPSAPVGSKAGVAVTDVCTGALASGAISSQLFRRERERQQMQQRCPSESKSKSECSTSPVGARIDASLMETQLSLLSNVASSVLNGCASGSAPRQARYGNAHESIVPYQTFLCKGGGSLVLCGTNDGFYVSIVEALGLRERLLDDEKNKDMYRTNALRVLNRVSLLKVLEERLLQKTLGEWIDDFESSKRTFPYGPVRSVSDAFACAQAVHRECVVTLPHPTVGDVRVPNHPVKHEGVLGAKEFRAPPVLGQHTREVLRDVLLKTEGEIDLLVNKGVVACS